MTDENQGQYLGFKNIQSSNSEKFRSQVVYANKNIYTTNQQIKRNTDKQRSGQRHKEKQVVVQKTKEQRRPSQKSPRSNCQIISFSTDSTKKHKQIQFTNKLTTNSNKKPITINPNNNDSNSCRLTKAKSDLNSWQKYKTGGSNLSKKLIEEVMEEIPLKYQLDFKTTQNQPNLEKISQLIHTIKICQTKIDRLQRQLQIKNKKIKELEIKNKQKFKQQCQIQSYLKPQNRYIHQQNRQNVRRLLKMLQMTQEYHYFAQFGLDDNGITLLTSVKNKTKIDCQTQQSYKKSMKLHFCSCNKQFMPEQYLWVPQSIYQFGQQFIKSKQNSSQQENRFLSKTEYELLLYQMNRMWRQRQKRIVNTIRHQKNLEIQKLKRKYSIKPTDKIISPRKNSKH